MEIDRHVWLKSVAIVKFHELQREIFKLFSIPCFLPRSHFWNFRPECKKMLFGASFSNEFIKESRPAQN